MQNVRKFLTKVSQPFKSNTQRVLHRLLHANGGWVAGDDLAQVVQVSAVDLMEATTARVRDLRKPQYGSFKVECASARDLHRIGGVKRFFYRINPAKITTKQVARVFKV
jgi:hypothetical protein